jgi:hypothetical protein
MVAQREDFEPFVEDDQGFDAYIKRMRKAGRPGYGPALGQLWGSSGAVWLRGGGFGVRGATSGGAMPPPLSPHRPALQRPLGADARYR